MKRNRSTAHLGLAAVLIIGLVLLPALVSGSSVTDADPLISLSYLNGTFRELAAADAAAKIDSVRGEMESALQSRIDSVQAAAQTSSSDMTTHTKITIASGSSYVAPEGAELLFLSGDATVSAAGLTDTTAGTALPANEALTAHHLYIAGGAVTIRASQTALLLIRK